MTVNDYLKLGEKSINEANLGEFRIRLEIFSPIRLFSLFRLILSFRRHIFLPCFLFLRFSHVIFLRSNAQGGHDFLRHQENFFPWARQPAKKPESGSKERKWKLLIVRVVLPVLKIDPSYYKRRFILAVQNLHILSTGRSCNYAVFIFGIFAKNHVIASPKMH